MDPTALTNHKSNRNYKYFQNIKINCYFSINLLYSSRFLLSLSGIVITDQIQIDQYLQLQFNLTVCSRTQDLKNMILIKNMYHFIHFQFKIFIILG
jgi:hypothetical protein